MTEQNTTPANDPWSPSTATTTPLPNLFTDLDDQPVTVITQMTATGDQAGGYVQIRFGSVELRLDPIEAQRLGEYVAKASDELHGQVLDVVLAP
ncbi:hypothetical protein [Streptomyces flavofungini]|uniref:hypothetical protein n=1 Tax=Streptomyces flavofungini TaxID=68200 RepID=UPI0025B080FC|nr:hypothetical protein [Streptomyces flavofungini]WJV47650.1 hypothetical protein QUY26_20250 [Streptomyces flavofungini]